MALISFARKKPCYAMMTGASMSAPTSSNLFYAFANTFLSSYNITRNSATRVTVNESGTFELCICLSIIAVGTNLTHQIQTGVNGVFTTQSTSNSVQNIQADAGAFRFIIEMNKNDYLELRSVITPAPASGHNTYCGVNFTDQLCPTITLKKLR